jgi:myo-inositol-1(or 4)-monophosphatase
MTELGFIRKFLEDNMAYARDKFAARGAITVTSKRDANDLLTEVDLTLQKRAIDQIHHSFPGDSIMAEEGEFAKGPDEPEGRCWVMDPIDGTNNFVRGLFPVYAISIAFAIHGRAVAGGIALPGVNTIFTAEHGKGAFHGKRRLVVSEVQTLEEAKVDLDFGGMEDRAAWLERGQEIIRHAGQLRGYGSAVSAISQIASGDLDAFLHMTLNPWDYAAAQLIVEEAGGMASRLDGKPLHLFDGKQGVLITNGAIHKEMLRLIRK